MNQIKNNAGDGIGIGAAIGLAFGFLYGNSSEIEKRSDCTYS